MAEFRKVPDTQPFSGRGLWLDRKPEKLTFEERCERICSFLRSHDIFVPEDHIAVLSYCHTAAELWFVREVTYSSGWERVGERSLSNRIHKISIGVRPTGVRIPILFEDLTRGYSVAFDIQAPKHFLPSILHRDKLRRAEIAKCVDKMYGIPDLHARRTGKSFRVDLMRQRVALLQGSPPKPKTTGGHYWTGGELTYDVTHLPTTERLPILEGWLKAFNRYVPSSLLPVLLHCERAGELLFVLQLLSFQRIKPSGNGFTIGSMYRITLQVQVGEWMFDILIEPISSNASWSRIVFEVEPATYFFRDLSLERKISDGMADIGFQVIRVAAENAKSLGRQWHERIANDLIKQSVDVKL